MSYLTLTVAKSYLRVSHSSDDTLIQAIIDGAEEFVTSTCQIAFTEASHTEQLDGGGRALWPRVCPVISITSVTDRETDSVESSDNYELVQQRQIVHDGETRWPDGRGRWQVVYTGGYGTTVAVPAGLKNVILELTRRIYDARGGADSEGASGWSVRWQQMLSGDIGILLAPYVRHSP